uniref:Uncharacterized protein n=1 Tax=Parascaris univalens TaxID=6257 RepID=A0A915BLJ6_PARUN
MDAGERGKSYGGMQAPTPPSVGDLETTAQLTISSPRVEQPRIWSHIIATPETGGEVDSPGGVMDLWAGVGYGKPVVRIRVNAIPVTRAYNGDGYGRIPALGYPSEVTYRRAAGGDEGSLARERSIEILDARLVVVKVRESRAGERRDERGARGLGRLAPEGDSSVAIGVGRVSEAICESLAASDDDARDVASVARQRGVGSVVQGGECGMSEPELESGVATSWCSPA